MTEAEKLRHVAGQWLRNALGRVRKQRECHPDSGSLDIKVAEYLLLSAQEYAQTAFDAFAAGRWHPALSCSRTIFEMAIKLKWCSLEEGDGRRDRLFSWARETKWSQKTIFHAFAKTAPDPQFRAAAHEAAERLQSDLNDNHVTRMPNFTAMFKEVTENSTDPQNGEFVKAVLYKQPCESAHAELAPERYFELIDGDEARRDGSEKPIYASWTILTSVLWLVVSTYEMLGWATIQFGEEYTNALQPDA